MNTKRKLEIAIDIIEFLDLLIDSRICDIHSRQNFILEANKTNIQSDVLEAVYDQEYATLDWVERDLNRMKERIEIDEHQIGFTSYRYSEYEEKIRRLKKYSSVKGGEI